MPEPTTSDSTSKKPAETTEKLKKGFLRGLISSLDEMGFVAAGAFGNYLFNRVFQNKDEGREVLEQAKKLIKEGKPEEAGELIIKSKAFGFGYEDEAGFLTGIAWAIQALLDAGESGKADNLVDSLYFMESETLDRLRFALAKIESVEQTGRILVKLAQIRNPKVRLARIAKITGLQLDPAKHPANVFVTEIGGAFKTACKGFRKGVDKKKKAILAAKRKRTRRMNAARRRRP